MTKHILFIFVFTFVVSTTGFAIMQDIEKLPPGKWWKNPDIVRYLKITDKEKSSLDQMYREKKKSMISIKAVMESQKLDMEALMDRDPLNETAIKDKYRAMLNEGMNLFEKQFEFLLEVRKLLGKNRFAHLKKYFHKKHWTGRKGRHHDKFKKGLTCPPPGGKDRYHMP